MDQFREQPNFEIQATIKQKPFESPAVQSFFTKWCEINDSIQPQMIGRDDWEQRGAKGILEKMPDGKQTLYLPKDLQLWEMVGVIEAVDHDTFATKPEQQDKAKKKLFELGKTFQNAGVYISQRLGSVNQGKEIAHALAEELYSYGYSLVNGQKSGTPQAVNDIASHDLTAEEIETVERFLAGDSLYESRRAQAEKLIMADPNRRDIFYEAQRRETLAQFFRVSEKAFLLQQKIGAGEQSRNSRNLKPWLSETPIHSAFLHKVARAMEKQIEAPKRELVGMIFRRGLRKLVGEMKEKKKWKHSIHSLFEKVGIDLGSEQRRLVNYLNLSGLKAELEAAKQAGEMTVIAQKEREIVDKIQQAVSSYPYPYQGKSDTPSEILASQFIDCVGASMLGGALLSEVGIKYLVGDVPKHSILVVVRSDGKIEWRDMRTAKFNEEITDRAIASKTKDGKPLTVKDIIAYANNPQWEGLMFDITGDRYKKKVPQVEKKQRQYLTVFPPEIGLQRQVLNNISRMFYDLGFEETDSEKQKNYYNQAVEAARETITIDPKYDSSQWRVLGNAFVGLGRKEEALEALRRATAINPEIATWSELGELLYDLGLNEIDPEKQKNYYSQAVEVLQEFVYMSGEQTDIFFHFGNAPLVRRARKIISELA